MGVLESLDDAIFGVPRSSASRRLRWALLACLFLAGAAYWAYFFNFGRVSLAGADWIWQSATLKALRSALLSGTMPWQWRALPGAWESYTMRYLTSIVPLTPDIVLLPVVSNAVFLLLHTLIFYSVGFVGSVRLARRANANLMSLSFFWLLFNFNGFIAAQLAVGHFEYSGYFLLPIFLDLALGTAVGSDNAGPTLDLDRAVWIGVLIGVLILNGSVHIAFWCCGFLLVMVLWRWQLVLTVGVAFLTGIGLGLGRLLPAALYVPSPGPFVSGYPNLGVLFAGFTAVRIPDAAYVLGGRFGALGWWEYDIYVGLAALLIVVVAAVVAFRAHGHRRIAPALAAGVALFVLSLGDIYALLRTIAPGVAGIERVSTRLIIIPFLLLLTIAMEGLAVATREWPRTSRICTLIAVPVVCWQLAMHVRLWTIADVKRLFPVNNVIPVLRLVPNTDPRYAAIVLGSWVVSLVALCVVVAVLWWRHRSGRSAVPGVKSDWVIDDRSDAPSPEGA